MAYMTESAGEQIATLKYESSTRSQILASILRLFEWLERNQYRGYDTFDGLSARLIRPLALDNTFFLMGLQQGVRRFPINLRPLLGIRKAHSSKGMGFLARGFFRLAKATIDPVWQEKARYCLDWLVAHQASGYSGACWGNHFDYVSRNGPIPKGMPTVVWTSLIGQAFLDGYEYFQDDQYLQIAINVCNHILRDLKTFREGKGVCINYTPGKDAWVHNANTLGGAILARTYAITRREEYVDLAEGAMQYTAQHQRPNGSWFYGEKENLHWVDSFHTGYVLDCFKTYAESTGDTRFQETLKKGYEFWKQTFFLPDGTPKYYDHKTMPIDIQCSAQAIDTLIFFSSGDPDALQLALKIARWTIANMQDKSGYFYYRRYSRWLVNKTPTLHWGQATMLCALSGLYNQLCSEVDVL